MKGDGQNDKLIRKKIEIAARGREAPRAPADARTSRLPPGQHLAKVWPVLDLGIKPQLRQDQFQLDVVGAVARPLRLRWADLGRFPRVTLVTDFHCVTTWSIFDNTWEGVRLRDVIDAAEPTAEARFVLFSASDGYTTNLPLDACRDDDALLVHGWNGTALSAEHGGPLRVIVPKRYGWKSAKWVRTIALRADDELGYWEVRGYSNSAFPWDEDRFS